MFCMSFSETTPAIRPVLNLTSVNVVGNWKNDFTLLDVFVLTDIPSVNTNEKAQVVHVSCQHTKRHVKLVNVAAS